MTTPLEPLFPLNQSERTHLAELADLLIPKKKGEISASEAGVAGHLLSMIEEFAPEKLSLLRDISHQAQQNGAEAALASLKERDRPTYDNFCETIAAVYFMSPDVRRHIGFLGREPVAARTDIETLENLLMPVLEGDFKSRI